jgi:hypothetical protein
MAILLLPLLLMGRGITRRLTKFPVRGDTLTDCYEMGALGSDFGSKGVFLARLSDFLYVFYGAIVDECVVVRGDLRWVAGAGLARQRSCTPPPPGGGGTLRVSLFFRMVCAGVCQQNIHNKRVTPKNTCYQWDGVEAFWGFSFLISISIIDRGCRGIGGSRGTHETCGCCWPAMSYVARGLDTVLWRGKSSRRELGGDLGSVRSWT